MRSFNRSAWMHRRCVPALLIPARDSSVSSAGARTCSLKPLTQAHCLAQCSAVDRCWIVCRLLGGEPCNLRILDGGAFNDWRCKTDIKRVDVKRTSKLPCNEPAACCDQRCCFNVARQEVSVFTCEECCSKSCACRCRCFACSFVAHVLATRACVLLRVASRSALMLAKQCVGRCYQQEDPRAGGRSPLRGGQLRA